MAENSGSVFYNQILEANTKKNIATSTQKGKRICGVASS